MKSRLIRSLILLALTIGLPMAVPVLAEKAGENTVAVCGCGKVFTINAKTEYLEHGGKRYACCTHECHEMAGKNPAESAAKWQQASARLVAGGRTREEIYAEIESVLGVVPSMFKAVPDGSLELEWNLFKQVQLAPGPIPNKYRELIGVAISGITKCHYCAYFHTQVAKLNGATDAEIEDALHYAKSSAGWSTYINGLQLDMDQFRKEVDQACAYVKAKMVESSR